VRSLLASVGVFRTSCSHAPRKQASGRSDSDERNSSEPRALNPFAIPDGCDYLLVVDSRRSRRRRIAVEISFCAPMANV